MFQITTNSDYLSILNILEMNQLAIDLFNKFINTLLMQQYDENKIANILSSIKILLDTNLISSDWYSVKEKDIKDSIQFSVLEIIINDIIHSLKIKVSTSSNNCDTQTRYIPSYLSLPIQSIESNIPPLELIRKLSCNINYFKCENISPFVKQSIYPNVGTVYIEVSRNAAIFKIPFGNNELLTLDECWCDEKLSRIDNTFNLRNEMEDNIVSEIVNSQISQKQNITIINLGSDKVAILVILSKLKLQGFENIQVLNLELKGIKTYIDYPKEEENFTKFIATVFGNSYTYKTILDEELDSIIAIINSDLTMVFAEDLGGVDQANYVEKYNTAIQNIVNKLCSSSNNNLAKVRFSEHSGNIVKVDKSSSSSLLLKYKY